MKQLYRIVDLDKKLKIFKLPLNAPISLRKINKQENKQDKYYKIHVEKISNVGL